METLTEAEKAEFEKLNAAQKQEFWATRCSDVWAKGQEIDRQLKHTKAQLDMATTQIENNSRDLDIQSNRLKLDQNNSIRKNLQLYARTIMTCDGSSKQSLRRFLESLEIAQLWSGADDKSILELASRLVTGNLASAMSKFVHVEMNGSASWAETKEYIKEQFLGKDELSALRSQLLRMAQTSYETVESYGRRFDQKAQKCYAPEELTLSVIQEQLIKVFVAGLQSTAIKTQVYLSNPKNLSQAIQFATESSRAFTLALENPTNGPAEPLDQAPFGTPLPVLDTDMEIGALGRDNQKSQKLANQKSISSKATHEGFSKRIDYLYDMVKSLKTQLSELQDSKRQNTNWEKQLYQKKLPHLLDHQQPLSQPMRQNTPATIKCHFCGGLNHTKYKCPMAGLIKCKHCFSRDHYTSECPSVRCHFCQKIGHISRNCPNTNRPPQQPKPAQINATEVELQNKIDFLEKHILELSLSPDNVIARTEENDEIIYEDETAEI